ncbi:hypothetical protein QU487_22035 [Crenobacter sp. SG2305]|uniref:hypothetical protein n=1 Tax=Crenobacter oryzisoli TaxID=3056844 RepID=UPI0025AABF04|nr:hypothetical protein [Crenobacter sp. SG2305]MDN0085386.1 hypothetical protein [Crenobacter sp. SG2305]
MFYKVKVVSEIFGVDFDGPLHPTEAHARRAAQTLLAVHSGKIVVEIHKLLDPQFRSSEIVGRLEK